MRSMHRVSCRFAIFTACVLSIGWISPMLPQAIAAEAEDEVDVYSCVGTCGDTNLSGSITTGDIAPMVTAITGGFAAWDELLPGPQTLGQFLCAADTNGDGTVSISDIGLFVNAVTSGSPCDF